MLTDCLRHLQAVTGLISVAILTGDVDAVSWLHFVDQVVVGVDDGCVWRLTRWHVFGRLLNFDL